RPRQRHIHFPRGRTGVLPRAAGAPAPGPTRVAAEAAPTRASGFSYLRRWRRPMPRADTAAHPASANPARSSPMSARQSGFTLLEAVIALAVASVLVGTAVPAVTGVAEAAHASSAQAALLATLTQSISHAAIAGSEVVLCPGDHAGCRDSSDWSSGWIA